MIKEKVLIVNELGLHARAASKLVTIASKFLSETKLLSKSGLDANCKSIMGLMMLGAAKGSELWLHSEGKDEEEAFLAVKALIDRKFDEKN